MGLKNKKQTEKNTTTRSRSRSSFKKIAILFFVLGIICASPIGHVIYVIGMISVIGIPVSLLVVAIVNLAIVIVMSFILWRFAPPFSEWRADVALAGGVLMMFLVPPLHNMEIKYKTHKLQSNQVNRLAQYYPFAKNPNRKLGIVMTDGRPLCSALCVHLLLSEQASSIILTSVKENELSFEPNAIAYEYSLRKQGNCQTGPKYRSGINVRKSTADRYPNSIAARYFKQIDKGFCISVEETTISDADMVVMVVERRDFPKLQTLSPLKPKFSGNFSAIYQKDDDGRLDPIWRQTAVNFSLLRPILFFTIHVHAGMSGTDGRLWREEPVEVEPSFKDIRSALEYIGYRFPTKLI